MSVTVTLISAVTGPEITFADRTVLLPISRTKTMQMFTRETPDFFTPTLWPANGPDRIWGKLQQCMYCSQIHGIDQLSCI